MISEFVCKDISEKIKYDLCSFLQLDFDVDIDILKSTIKNQLLESYYNSTGKNNLNTLSLDKQDYNITIFPKHLNSAFVSNLKENIDKGTLDLIICCDCFDRDDKDMYYHTASLIYDLSLNYPINMKILISSYHLNKDLSYNIHLLFYILLSFSKKGFEFYTYENYINAEILRCKRLFLFTQCFFGTNQFLFTSAIYNMEDVNKLYNVHETKSLLMAT